MLFKSYVYNQTGNVNCNNTLKKRTIVYLKNLSRLYNGYPRPLNYFYDSIYRTQMVKEHFTKDQIK